MKEWIQQFNEALAEIGDLDRLSLEFVPLYVSAFFADENVQVMSCEQRGAYIPLLLRGWMQRPPASLPDDDEKLAGWSVLTLQRWKKIKADVMRPFDQADDGRWYQKRLAREWLKSARLQLGRRRGAENTNLKRWTQNADAERSVGGSHSDPLSDSSKRSLSDTASDALSDPVSASLSGRIERPDPTREAGRDGPRGRTASGKTGFEHRNGSGSSGTLGTAAHRNLRDAERNIQRSKLAGLLEPLHLNPSTQAEILNRTDLTFERVEAEIADIRRDPAADIAAVLVHRLRKGTNR